MEASTICDIGPTVIFKNMSSASCDIYRIQIVQVNKLI